MNRSGRAQVSFLVLVVLLAAGVYCGIGIGGVYFRQYQFGEAVVEWLSFAGQRDVDGIRQGILQRVSEMSLPPEARRFTLVNRDSPRRLEFRVRYSETVNLIVTQWVMKVDLERTRRY